MRISGWQRIVPVHFIALALSLSAAHAAERTGIGASQRFTGEGNGAPVLVLPTRRTADAPPAAPPALPAAADRITPLTLEMTVRWQPTAGHAQTLQQTVSRTADRVHVVARNGREWLFERNVRDPRRVSASLVDHASKAIVLYEESGLRMMLGIRGWADVVALGFDMDGLSSYKQGREVRTLGGIRFARYATRKDASTEVWWSEEHVLPLGFTTMDTAGSMRFSIRRVRSGADATLLRAPDARFPTYRVFDLADWLERHGN